MPFWNVQSFDFNALLGYEFDYQGAVSSDTIYGATNNLVLTPNSINNPDYQVSVPNTWWTQLSVPYSQSYSVFGELGVPTQTTGNQVGVDSLNFIRFQPTYGSGSTYWMMSPKTIGLDVVEHPLKNLSTRTTVYTPSSASNPSQSLITSQQLGKTDYLVTSTTPKGYYDRYSIYDLLGESVKCVDGCDQTLAIEEPIRPDPGPDPVGTPEPSQFLGTLIVLLFFFVQFRNRRKAARPLATNSGDLS